MWRSSMKVMTIMGTRPEMIKMWSVLKKLDELNFDHIMVHTGQNYTKELKDFFFKDLELIEPDALIILGDTYSGLSVLPASHYGIKIFHMEAGLRAWDKRMPEQRNRILIDHMSDILLPFHHHHRDNLIREDIHPSKIFITGNPTFEPMRHFHDQIEASKILAKLKIKPKEYVAMTAHRSENVDAPESLQEILDAAGLVAKKLKVEVI